MSYGWHKNKRHFKNEQKVPTVSVSRKFGKLHFGKRTLASLGMENCFIQLSYDSPHKVIAWKLKKIVEQHELKAGWKLVKRNIGTDSFSLSVAYILGTFIGLNEDSYKNLPVKKYADYQSKLDSDEYYYIEVK